MGGNSLKGVAIPVRVRGAIKGHRNLQGGMNRRERRDADEPLPGAG